MVAPAQQSSDNATGSSDEGLDMRRRSMRVLDEGIQKLINTYGWKQVYKSLMKHPNAVTKEGALTPSQEPAGTARVGGSGVSRNAAPDGLLAGGVGDGSGAAGAAAALAAGPGDGSGAAAAAICPTTHDGGAVATGGGGTPAPRTADKQTGRQAHQGARQNSSSMQRSSQQESSVGDASDPAAADKHLQGAELAKKILSNKKLFNFGECVPVEGVTVHCPGYALSGLSGQKRPDNPSSEGVLAFLQKNKRQRSSTASSTEADHPQLNACLSSWEDRQASNSGDCAESSPYQRVLGARQYDKMAKNQVGNCLNISLGGTLLDLEGQLRAVLKAKNLLRLPCSLTSLVNGYNKSLQAENDEEAETDDDCATATTDDSFLKNKTVLTDAEASVIRDWLQMPANAARGRVPLKELGRGKLSECLKLAKCAEAFPLLHMSMIAPSELYKSRCVQVVRECVKALSLILTENDFDTGVPRQMKKAIVEFSRMLLTATVEPCLPPSAFEFTSDWEVDDGDGITIITSANDDDGTPCRYKIRLANIDSLEHFQPWLIANKLLQTAKDASVQVRVRYCFYKTRRRHKPCRMNTGDISAASNVPQPFPIEAEEGRYICSVEMRPDPSTAIVNGSTGTRAAPVLHEMSEWLLGLGATQISPLFLLADTEESLRRLFRLQGRAVNAGRKALMDAIAAAGASAAEAEKAAIGNVTLDDIAVEADFYRLREFWNSGTDMVSTVIPSNENGGADYRAEMERYIDGSMPVTGAASTTSPSRSTAMPSSSGEAPISTPTVPQQTPIRGFNIWSSLLYNNKDGGRYPKALFMERSQPDAGLQLLIRNPWWTNDNNFLGKLPDDGMYMGMPWPAKAIVNDPSWTGR